ncbi:MAG: hypothetical protein ACYDIE_02820 [Candidatus Krumholzibacteriia bacterium]
MERHFLDRVAVTALTLDANNYYIESRTSIPIDVSRDFDRMGRRDERIIVPGTCLAIAIPYTGSKVLWRLQPSQFSLSGYPDLDIRDDVVVFNCTFPDDAADPARIKTQIADHVRSLTDAVANIARDVAHHNRTTRQEIPDAIARKRAKALTALNAVAALGIPVQRRGQPLTFTVPTTRRETPLARPLVATEPYAPEPTLDQREFEHILRVLGSMSLVMERSPADFAALNEEAIRTHFLIQLNGHYEGGASGETFNASGKTDILIRSGGRNIFIAECKFWRGQQYFNRAVDQLLNYLTWRDSKCALLVFNRAQGSSAVKRKMHEVMIARPEHRRTVTCDKDGCDRYVFVKPADPGREIRICTLLFSIPRATTEEDVESMP